MASWIGNFAGYVTFHTMINNYENGIECADLYLSQHIRHKEYHKDWSC
jgi:CRISPR/Cas system CMR-associated protein Cmr3 (group 5 of RAMP superfamily)